MVIKRHFPLAHLSKFTSSLLQPVACESDWNGAHMPRIGNRVSRGTPRDASLISFHRIARHHPLSVHPIRDRQTVGRLVFNFEPNFIRSEITKHSSHFNFKITPQMESPSKWNENDHELVGGAAPAETTLGSDGWFVGREGKGVYDLTKFQIENSTLFTFHTQAPAN